MEIETPLYLFPSPILLESLELASSFGGSGSMQRGYSIEMLLDPSKPRDQPRTLAISLIGLTNCHSRLEEEEATFHSTSS